MKRRFGMWMTIICILVVGVSVTKMTHDFVVSKGVETVTIVSVMEDAGSDAEVAAGSGQTEETTDMASAFRKAASTAVKNAEKSNSKIAVGQVNGPGADVETEAETESETEAQENSQIAVAEAGMEEMMDAIPDEDSAEIVEAAEPMAAALTEAGPDAEESTVKSPLDPVVESVNAAAESIEEVTYTAEDFFARFESAEKSSAQLWENVTYDNYVAYNAAAEQERVLWDYELNFVYGEIRSKMSEKEAEALKSLELEWIKERDLYAEKMAAKSGKRNAQNQNPDYIKAMAEKTKERCYWLVTEYEDVLKRENE